MRSRPGAAPLVFVCCLLLAFIIYRPALTYPYVQDDWPRLNEVARSAPGDLLEQLVPRPGTFYRPLVFAYFLTLERLFGLDALGAHVLSVLALTFQAVLLGALISSLGGSAPAAWAAAALHLGAALVHWGPILGATGIGPLAATLGALAAMLLFVRGHHLVATIPFLAGILFWETPLLVPAAALVWVLIQRPRVPLKACLPFLVVLTGYVLVRATAWEAPPPEHPYAMSFTTGTMTRNLASYAAWALGCVVPMTRPPEPPSWDVPPPVVFAAVALAIALFVRLVSRRSLSAFWLVWIAAGLLPVLFLQRMAYRYYLCVSLPALVGATAMGLDALGRQAGLAPRTRAGLLATLAAACAAGGALHIRGLDSGRWPWRSSDGTGALTERGRLVRLVWDELTRLAPALPRGSVLVFGNVDVWAFDKDSGPQAWYGDETLKVYELAHVARDGQALVVAGAPETQVEAFTGPVEARVIPLDPATTSFVARRGESLVLLAYDDVRATVRPISARGP